MPVGVVVQFGLRFAPGACEVRGSNPRDPTKMSWFKADYGFFTSSEVGIQI